MFYIRNIVALLAGIVILSGCSQRYAFRKTVPAAKDRTSAEARKPVRQQEEPVTAAVPDVAADTITHGTKKENPETLAARPLRQRIESASAGLRELIPFSPEQLSPAEQPYISGQKPTVPGGFPILPFLAFVCALLSVALLLLIIFISSYTIGIILLFAAPVFAAIGLILGMTSLSNEAGKEMALASIIISLVVLLIMLIVLMVSYLFLQSRNK